VQRAVKQATGLVCSVGIGDNRLRAKLATGFAKPAGVYRLTRDNWMRVMAERPPEALWGIGSRTARKLADAGITIVRQLAGTDTDELAQRFGPTMGPWYRALALGVGGTDVSADRYLPRSRSRETTFQQNITARVELENELVALAERVARDVAEEGRPAGRVAVKVRFAPFFTQTRSVTLPAPTRDPGEITKAALALLERFEPGRPVRLLGVRAEFERVG
jgi:DNA polymerase IV